MNHILIAEDEHLIARLVEMTLTRAGYRCTVAEDGRTAADLIEKTDFDMAILDIMLPGLDGYDLLASLKPQGVPVIFLTAKSAVKDRVLGLRLGADDYITKPFAAEELVARMETVLRRTGRGGRELRAFDIRLDTQDRTAWRGDAPLDLRDQCRRYGYRDGGFDHHPVHLQRLRRACQIDTQQRGAGHSHHPRQRQGVRSRGRGLRPDQGQSSGRRV